MMFPAQLNRRQLVGEVMDQPDLEIQSHEQALRGLRRINRFSRAAAIMGGPIQQLARDYVASDSRQSLRILDLASGAGDLPIALSEQARRRQWPLTIAGCDKSPAAIEFARDNARQHQSAVSFFQRDLMDQGIPEGYDIITCSLFLHHLEESQVIGLLQQMRDRARQMIVVSDLRRSYAGYLLAWAATRLLTRSPVVHIDGPLSVRAAFSIPEMHDMARQAGLDGVRLTRKWPFRFLMTWQRP